MAEVKRDRSKEKTCLCISKEKMIFVMRKKNQQIYLNVLANVSLYQRCQTCALYFRTMHGGTFDYVRIKSQCL